MQKKHGQLGLVDFPVIVHVPLVEDRTLQKRDVFSVVVLQQKEQTMC